MNTRTVILRDIPLMQEPEDELKSVQFALETEGIKANFVADLLSPNDLNDHRFELLIIDYGGMASMGAWDTALFNLRYTLKWLEDHPSKVAIVWTMFTAELAKEIYDSFKDAPANVFIWSEADKGFSDGTWDQIRALLGVESPWVAPKLDLKVPKPRRDQGE